MKRKLLRILSLMTAMILLTAALPATAETRYDGNISITLGPYTFIEEDEKEVDIQTAGIQLIAYLIATGDYGSWTPVKPLEGLTFSDKEDDPKWVSDTASLLESKLLELKSITATAVAINEEKTVAIATFSGLPRGVYYIKLLHSPDPHLFDTNTLLAAVPNKRGMTSIPIDFKPVFRGSDWPKPDDGEYFDDYDTALGLGNIQMHVGVCFE